MVSQPILNIVGQIINAFYRENDVSHLVKTIYSQPLPDVS